MQPIIIALLKCSISMSVITLLYALIQPILSKRYAPQWRYAVWLVIAVGWLIPFRPLVELPFLSAQSANMPLMPVQVIPASPSVSPSAGISSISPDTVFNIPQLSMWDIGFFLWLAGIIFILIYHIWRHSRFIKMVSRWSVTQTTPEIRQLLDTLKQEQRIKAKIEYKICPSISSPMMVGFFKPVILMPPIKLSEKELTLILRHELTHFRRHDLWCKTIVLLATILHWFNPVVYLMARATSAQCEISCDSLILKDEDMQTRRQYGETILAIVHGDRAHETVLSTNFYGGIRGMKNRITSILDSKRKKAGITVLCIVLVGIIFTGATLVASESRSTYIPNTSFADEEYSKLLALRFDGYEDMSISEFQKKVWSATDTTEYMALLERFYEDVQLEEMKDTNDIASFLFYELIPLTSENWKSRYFMNGATTKYEDAENNAEYDYTCTLDIADAATLTVGEYSKTRKAVMDELLTFFQSRSEEELQDESGMMKLIDGQIETLTQTWDRDNVLTIRIDYFFIPLEVYASYENMGEDSNNEEEKREYPNGTEEDYSSLLALKTTDYQSQALNDFNADLLEWGNNDYDRAQKIGVDTALNDFAVSLTPEELSFVTLTVKNSNNENTAMIKSDYTGKPKEDIGFSDSLPEKESQTSWCSLYYQGSYHITDESRITVGERDRCVGGVINDIQKYWDDKSLDEILTMSKEDVLARLEEIAAQYSNDLITISIIPDQVSFELMNEQISSE